jgi:thioredoxin reductase (NADPH)
MWKDRWDPFFMETSIPGLFAAGDVRHNSTKRCATAAGDGATAVSMAHQFLTVRKASTLRRYCGTWFALKISPGIASSI